METDEMELDTIGDRKTALFVIISDTDDTFNFVVSILYTQLWICPLSMCVVTTYSCCPFVTASASCFPISWAFS